MLFAQLLALIALPLTHASPGTCPPLTTFACPATRSTLLSSSWCAASNPLVFPQPPEVRDASAGGGTQLRPQCADGGDPFADCVLIDKFAATEVTGIGGAKVKLLAITERADGGANASLSFFDEHLALLATPVAGFPGRLNLLDTARGPPLRGTTNASTLLIGYGGTRTDVPAALIMFEVFNSSMTVADGVFLPEFAFVGAGVYSVPHATALDFAFFTAALNGSEATAAGLPEGESTFAALTVARAGAGVSVLFFGLLPDTSPACHNPHLVSPCFAEMGEWALYAGGAPADAPVRVRIADAWAACTQPAGAAAAIAAAYVPFYTAASCAARTTLIAISSGTTVSTLAFLPSPGAVLRVDIDAGASVRAYDARASAPAGAASIVDFAIVSSRVLVAPDLGAAGAVAAPPAAVWLIVLTGADNAPPGASPDASLLAVGLGAFSIDRSATAAAAAGRGNPAAAPVECPGWGAFWDGTKCAANAVRDVFGKGGLDVGGVSIEAAWRAIPPALAAPLISAGCLWWNATCVGEMIARLAGGGSPPLRTDSAALALGWRARLDAGHTLGSIVDDLIAAIAGDRFAVFVALTSRQIAVLEVTPMPPCAVAADVDSLGAAVSLDNVLQLAGAASSLHVTPNAQYVFASTVRPRFALASMDRAVDICAALAATPADPFLVSFAGMCAGAPPPRRPVTADFLLVATACLPGTLCPSFDEEVAVEVPAGYYTALGFSALACPPGSYCTGGRTIACPPGFQCPAPGLALPVPCGYDNSLTTTCSRAGTVAPEPCPDGSLCTAPYLPPLPAPPGFATNTSVLPDAATGGNYTFRGLSVCTTGEWCGFGRAEPTAAQVNASGGSSLLSPPGTFTSVPGTLEPVVCNFGGACNASACPIMPFCPAGSSAQLPCPAGFYCQNNEVAAQCSTGTYCPKGSALWTLCPARSYCPDPATLLECPRGSYCPAGVATPVRCTVLMDCTCDGGCDAPPLSVPATTAGGVIFFAGLAFLGRWLLRMRRGRAAAPAAAAVRTKDASAVVEEASADAFSAPLLPPRASLNGGVEIGVAAPPVALPPRKHRLTVSFAELSVDLFSGARVLNGVSGHLRAGRVTAIMGPSGAGKTTLLSALSGKAAAYGRVGGTLAINGIEGRALADPRVRHLVGFVPQEDVMLRDQTVESIIHFAAVTRLPASLPAAAKRAHADAVIDVLGLREIRTSIIGDELTRGISGGQRKRVNIGIELAADPLVLLLDEPTSGLDAAASLDVCSALQRIAASGVTVALVLHQPRFEIFSSFDDLVLLAKGGRVAFAGAVIDALPHFEACGFACPPRVNPADFIVDIVGYSAAMLTARWVAQQGGFEGSRADGSGGGGDGYGESSLPPPDPLPSVLLAAHFCARSLRQQRAAPSVILVNLLFVCTSAMFLAWLYVGTPSYAAPAPIETFAGCAPRIASAAQNCLAEAGDDVLNRSVMAVIAVSLTGVATALRVFASERAVYFREAAALPQPAASIAYFVGKDAASLPQVVAGALAFTIAYGALATPRASFGSYFFAFLGVNFCASALGHVTAVLSPPALAQLVGVVSVFANAQFAGGAPTLVALRAKAAPLRWLPALSYARYALEALYTAEVSPWRAAVALQGVDQAALVRDNFGFELDAWARDVAILFGIGFVLRAVALAALLLCDSAKKL